MLANLCTPSCSYTVGMAPQDAAVTADSRVGTSTCCSSEPPAKTSSGTVIERERAVGALGTRH
eukprot:4015851-Alexandrium_andersonii.AAC.1